MAGIKEIRTRITSVQNTQKITSAMKMVSAAKLRKAQTAVLQMRPYSEKLKEIIENITSASDDITSTVFSEQKHSGKTLLIPISSNGGLCGGFNSNISKQSIYFINTSLYDEFSRGNIEIFSIGKKVRDLLKTKGYAPNRDETDIYSHLSYSSASEIADEIMFEFLKGNYNKVFLVYNKFKNAATQEVTVEQFLPVASQKQDKAVKQNNYIFEPSESTIISELIPKTLKLQFYNALLESVASEHGARMTAMHAATDNASVLLKDLKIEYNKARQASITNEILEIVSGANALRG
ncbi:MAG: ATP synthase F1 subunit gamma [Bacteroidales bacterium]|nr:ATP synthase F1 subunit gamma [Bacteroidales bacterium]